MKSFSARRMIPACAITAVGIAAVALPGAASAASTCVKTEPETAVRGKGSSAQKAWQKEIWNPGFNTSADPSACNGTQGEKGTPKVTYESTGSGAGLRSWGVEQKKPGEEELWFGPKNAFVGTEIAPNTAQKEAIESHTEGGKLLTIPVGQPAIAIIIHLPKGCEGVEGGPTPGVIALKQKTLEQVFEGKKTKWSQLLNKAKMKEKVKKQCEKTGHITRVVREDGSGTTDWFMKFMNTVDKGKVVTESGKTWAQEGELGNNTEWPKEKEDAVVRGNGGGGVVSAVVATEGSIGYADVSTSRANLNFISATEENAKKEKGKGGPGSPIFWANVENGKGSYANPASNGEVAGISNSNCEETVYTNGGGKKAFPPPGVEEPWNEVTTSLTQKHYPLCYLTFDLALTKYKGATKGTFAGTGEEEPAEPTKEEAQTVSDYIGYELSAAGQGALLGQDALGDPTSAEPSKNVLKLAQEGVAKIGF